jgi:hypothetical protein
LVSRPQRGTIANGNRDNVAFNGLSSINVAVVVVARRIITELAKMGLGLFFYWRLVEKNTAQEKILVG